jgi:hypothetical protein
MAVEVSVFWDLPCCVQKDSWGGSLSKSSMWFGGRESDDHLGTGKQLLVLVSQTKN